MLSYFNESNIKVYIYIFIGIFSILFGLIPIIVIKMGKRAETNIDEKRKEFEESWKNKKTPISYQMIHGFLKKNGVEFHFKEISEPIGFVEVSILCGFLLALIASFFNLYLIIPAYILGIAAPFLIIKYQNSKDNKDMLFDISLIYNALYTQIEAGVFPDDAIRECYSVISNERLRKEMYTLTGNMERRDLSFSKSLGIFGASFDNSQIESLKIILEQAKESGKAAEALRDVLEQIQEIEEALLFFKKEKVATRNQILELSFFAGIVIVIITYSVQFIYSTLIGF